MFQQKQDKFTAMTVTEKPRPQKSFVQLEGKLTQEQLEAIAGGSDSGDTGNHNQSVVRLKKRIKSPLAAKSSQKKSSGQIERKLTQEQLEAIAGGAEGSGGGWGGNHNEIMVSTAELNGQSSISTQSGRLTH